MFALSALLLASVTAATPTTKMPWFEFHDYPMKAFEKHQQGVTRFDLLVDPTGRPVNCIITKSSGYPLLDEGTCKMASFRARFSPARGPDGQPIYGVFRTQAVWAFPEETLPNTEPGPDLQVDLNMLPEGTLHPPVVKLAYLVDPEGRVAACGPLRGERMQPQTLVDLGCREVTRLPAEPAKTVAGQAVPAVRTAAVEFKVPGSAAEPGR